MTMWYVENTTDGQRYPVTGTGITIGRRDCTINIPDTDRMASRRHAVVRRRGDSIEVEDSGSTNGTFLGTVRVMTPMIWTAGVPLRCGSTTFHLVREGDPSPARPTDDQANDPLLQQILTLEEYTPAPQAPEPPAAPALHVPPPAARPKRLAPRPAPAPIPLPLTVPSVAPAPPAESARPRRAGSPLSSIIAGLLMLSIGLAWWQNLRLALLRLDQLFIGSAPVNPRELLREAMSTQLLYIGAIILACLGGAILFIGLAMAFPRRTPRA